MSTLHTVNRSPYSHEALRSCVKICAPSDAILLLEDGVLGALPSPHNSHLSVLIQEGVKVFAIDADVQARGLASRLISGVTLIDYEGFVELTIQHTRVQSWY